MRRLGLACLLASLALPAAAQDLPKKITGDLDGDGAPDTVELRANPEASDFVDVSIALSASKRTLRVAQFSGAQEVQIARIANGELQLGFGWFQGRYKSSWTFAIGLQGKELVVRRYETAVADSISTDKNGVVVRTCKADFVANRLTVNGKPARAPGPARVFARWGNDAVPKACQSLF
jgi:hypothetical protein